MPLTDYAEQRLLNYLVRTTPVFYGFFTAMPDVLGAGGVEVGTYRDTLSANMAFDATTLTVTGTPLTNASGFTTWPVGTTTDFAIRVGNEVMLCTNVAPGGVLTVLRDTNVAHMAGEDVFVYGDPRTGYGRALTTFGLPVSSTSGTVCTNSAEVQSNVVLASWGTIVGAGLFDDSRPGHGNLLTFATLADRNVDIGDQLRALVGALTVTLD